MFVRLKWWIGRIGGFRRSGCFFDDDPSSLWIFEWPLLNCCFHPLFGDCWWGTFPASAIVKSGGHSATMETACKCERRAVNCSARRWAVLSTRDFNVRKLPYYPKICWAIMKRERFRKTRVTQIPTVLASKK